MNFYNRDTEDNDHDKPPKDSTQPPQRILTDDMYDFPRSHHIETEGTIRRHCYNNAAPVPFPEGTIFRYDISPKPGTSTIVSIYSNCRLIVFFCVTLLQLLI